MDPYENDFEDDYDDYDQSDYYEDEDDIFWDEFAHNMVNMNLHSDLYDDVPDDYGYDPWDILGEDKLFVTHNWNLNRSPTLGHNPIWNSPPITRTRIVEG